MKLITRIAALGLSCALLLAGCGKGGASNVDPQAEALTVDGVIFTAQDYAAAVRYNKGNMDAMLEQYGMSVDDLAALGTNQETYNSQITALAQDQLTYLAVCENQMKAAGLTLDEAALDAELATQQEQLGGAEQLAEYLEKLGLSQAQYRRFVSLTTMIDQLTADYKANNPDAARTYFDENYLRCKHVLVKTVDDNNEELDDQAGLEALAKEIAQRAKAGEDFDSLIAAYNEDPGMESNPEGYVFEEGTMVDEFYQGTKALALNAVSDPIKTSYGWHIILRLPLRDTDFTANEEAILSKLFAEQAETWMQDAAVTEADFLDQITVETAADYQ